MLKTKSIKAPIEPSDGLRISVMSRHTLNDGITPDPEISPDSYDEWWPELAPSPKLVGDHYKRNLSWIEFERRYLGELLDKPKLEELIGLALCRTVTILCVESSPDECHRRLLAEECGRFCPELDIEIY